MAMLEDTVNIPLCGLFLEIFSLICFDAFSAVTVQYSHNHSCHVLNTLTRLIRSMVENLVQKRLVVFVRR